MKKAILGMVLALVVFSVKADILVGTSFTGLTTHVTLSHTKFKQPVKLDSIVVAHLTYTTNTLYMYMTCPRGATNYTYLAYQGSYTGQCIRLSSQQLWVEATDTLKLSNGVSDAASALVEAKYVVGK